MGILNSGGHDICFPISNSWRVIATDSFSLCTTIDSPFDHIIGLSDCEAIKQNLREYYRQTTQCDELRCRKWGIFPLGVLYIAMAITSIERPLSNAERDIGLTDTKSVQWSALLARGTDMDEMCIFEPLLVYWEAYPDCLLPHDCSI